MINFEYVTKQIVAGERRDVQWWVTSVSDLTGLYDSPV